ncbi:MAG: hypothetical protein B7X46_05000 [Thiomonas sp. 15-66-11]|jgi:type IV fimbrial biogenesis protein FimT|uniref:Type II secretion system protein H n=1 Tax=Thiomonas delicata TaxID=364030 RepID=A0A238D405_THIDL|nr:GspH/FimT family pseudopilin [Thiomonas delicata]OZB45307.1 MAG: hypothetical protein B7X46_05000 [Thiomonas sp. 15-66-11]OZB51430.1 MAG: hypothetical protein B7X42_03585 [Thiomonas sp. 14-66-4]SBP88038.1 putative type-4 fimbrial pilin related signal peptide protein [Thiomonas delicata]
MKTLRGMTLVELLVAVTLVTILLVVGIPSYQGISTANRMAGEMNALISDLQYARSEAVKQGQTVTICVSSTGNNCSNSANWASGWIVFSDADGSQTVNSGEPVLRVQPALGSFDSLQSNSSPTIRAVTFNRNGFSSNAGSITLNDGASSTDRRKCAVVSSVGYVQLQTGASCP